MSPTMGCPLVLAASCHLAHHLPQGTDSSMCLSCSLTSRDLFSFNVLSCASWISIPGSLHGSWPLPSLSYSLVHSIAVMPAGSQPIPELLWLLFVPCSVQALTGDHCEPRWTSTRLWTLPRHTCPAAGQVQQRPTSPRRASWLAQLHWSSWHPGADTFSVAQTPAPALWLCCPALRQVRESHCLLMWCFQEYQEHRI